MIVYKDHLKENILYSIIEIHSKVLINKYKIKKKNSNVY